MIRNHLGWLLAASLAASGCTAQQDLGNHPETSDSGNANDSASSDGGVSGPLTGTLNSQPFASMSAISQMAAGEINLIFSDKPGLCASVSAGKIRAGESLLQLYNLVRGADGTYAPSSSSSDVKVAVFDPACTVAYRASATSKQAFSVQLTRIDADVVEGTLTITFDSGSKISGTFSAPSCASTLTEKDVCQ